MGLRFQKWQALGNDYVIVERDAAPVRAHAGARAAHLRAALRRRLGRRAAAVPAGDERFVAALRIFNPDGSEAELSGNGAREAILYLRRQGWTDDDTFSIATRRRRGHARRSPRARTCSVEMGRAQPELSRLPLGRRRTGAARSTAAGRALEFQHVSIGNPQCVIEARARSWRGSTWARSARRSSTASCSRTAPTSSFIRIDSEHQRARADLRARGGGDALVGDRRLGRRGRGGAARRASRRSTVALDGGELEVDGRATSWT